MSKFIYDLGVKAKDKITGFEGILVGRADHITGCNTYGIKGGLDKEGNPQDAVWFDEGMITKTGKGIKPNTVKAKDNGGPLSEHPSI